MSIPQNNSTKNINSKGQNNNKRPEVRDHLDSRKNEEQEIKGNSTTNNKKETEGEKLKRKK